MDTNEKIGRVIVAMLQADIINEGQIIGARRLITSVIDILQDMPNDDDRDMVPKQGEQVYYVNAAKQKSAAIALGVHDDNSIDLFSLPSESRSGIVFRDVAHIANAPEGTPFWTF